MSQNKNIMPADDEYSPSVVSPVSPEQSAEEDRRWAAAGVPPLRPTEGDVEGVTFGHRAYSTTYENSEAEDKRWRGIIGRELKEPVDDAIGRDSLSPEGVDIHRGAEEYLRQHPTHGDGSAPSYPTKDDPSAS